MRCQYCHNPDTWSTDKNQKMSVEDIMARYNSVKEFLQNGGITVTGGEPMMQMEFVTELFKTAKAQGVHTAIDTSGVLFNKNNTEKVDELLKYTDLVLLDLKHIDDEEHKKLTSHSNKNILDFAQYLSDKDIPMWVRHVVIPTITYNEEYLARLGKYLHNLKNLKAIDVLPYHTMAVPKYEKLGMKYPLADVPALEREQAINARNIIFQNFKQG